MFELVIDYFKQPSLLGRPVMPGQPSMTTLAVPMILLNLIDELRSGGKQSGEPIDRHSFQEDVDWALDRLRLHVNRDKRLVFENVGLKGELLLDSPDGRLVNPGHAIEGGWFLLRFFDKYYSESLLKREFVQMGSSIVFPIFSSLSVLSDATP